MGRDTTDFKKTINIKKFKELWAFEGSWKTFTITRNHTYLWETTVNFEVFLNASNPYMQLSVSMGSWWEKETKIYKVYLDYTKSHYWWKRWRFLCPCSTTRCWVLYLQRNGVFACRKTLNLAYDCQSRSKREREDLMVIKNIRKAEKLLSEIKYTSWKWKPTKKFKRYRALSKWKNGFYAEKLLQECIWKYSKQIKFVAKWWSMN
jgi:hypothetical protein